MADRDAAFQLWTVNDDLWNKTILPLLLIPLEEKGGVHTTGLWKHIVATTFGNAIETFQAVHILCNPSHSRQYWRDAYVLTRSNFEAFVTLEWIAVDPDSRSSRFMDEFTLKQAHFLDMLEDEKEKVDPSKRLVIYQQRDEVLAKYSRGPGTLNLMPSLEERVRSPEVKAKYQKILWEYDMYYRDVSSFSHPSGWGLFSRATDLNQPVMYIESTPEIGFKALLCNVGWFFRILDCFNRVFQVVPSPLIQGWHDTWTKQAAALSGSR